MINTFEELVAEVEKAEWDYACEKDAEGHKFFEISHKQLFGASKLIRDSYESLEEFIDAMGNLRKWVESFNSN